MPYGMGQVRYNNAPTSYGILEGKETPSQTTQNTIWQGEYFSKNNIANSYKDYRIRRVATDSSEIDPSKVYLLHFKANRNTTYDMTFDLKLCSSTTNDSEINTSLSDYQNIRRFTIRRDTSHAASLVSVILFDRFDKLENQEKGYTDVRVLDTITFPNGITITKEGQSIEGQELDENRVYVGVKIDETGNVIKEGYFYCNTNKKWTYIENSNVEIESKTWEQLSSENALKASFDFVIKNSLLNGNNNNINTIVFEMVRQPWDADIENKDGSKGLKLEGIEWEIYELQNLLYDESNKSNSIIPVSPVSTIGVWGHPNQILTINGEEIRIGQSGYYELTDFEIRNLCIAALSPEDRFTLDYQYKLND